jgi:hypothetical protein
MPICGGSHDIKGLFCHSVNAQFNKIKFNFTNLKELRFWSLDLKL